LKISSNKEGTIDQDIPLNLKGFPKTMNWRRNYPVNSKPEGRGLRS
jgi:hypothetical protein